MTRVTPRERIAHTSGAVYGFTHGLIWGAMLGYALYHWLHT